MAQMIGAELRFEAVRGMAERCGHYSRIGDDHVEGFALASSSSAQARTLLRLARSSATSSKLPPLAAASFRTWAVAASAFFKSRAAPTTCAPCAARERAVSTPIRPKRRLPESFCLADSRRTEHLPLLRSLQIRLPFSSSLSAVACSMCTRLLTTPPAADKTESVSAID